MLSATFLLKLQNRNAKEKCLPPKFSQNYKHHMQKKMIQPRFSRKQQHQKHNISATTLLYLQILSAEKTFSGEILFKISTFSKPGENIQRQKSPTLYIMKIRRKRVVTIFSLILQYRTHKKTFSAKILLNEKKTSSATIFLKQQILKGRRHYQRQNSLIINTILKNSRKCLAPKLSLKTLLS